MGSKASVFWTTETTLDLHRVSSSYDIISYVGMRRQNC